MTRIKKFQKNILEKKLGAFFLLDKTNIFYLTKLLNPWQLWGAKLLLIKNEQYLFLPKDFQKLPKTSMKIESLSDFRQISKELLSRNRIRKVGYLKSEMTIQGLEKARRVFRGRSLMGISDAISEMRMQKDKEEMRIIMRAAGIINKSFTKIRKLIRAGVSEKELAAKFIEIIKDNGAEDISFPPVIAFGSNSAYPHHQPTARKLRKNEDSSRRRR